MKKLSILDQNYGSIFGESSVRSGSLVLSEENGSFDPESEQRHRSTVRPRWSSVCEDIYSIQMTVYKADASKEFVVRKSADLEEMIAMSVFNAQYFNHYCV